MKSVLNIHWKDWYWSWNSSTLAIWWEELTHWKRPRFWERWKAGRLKAGIKIPHYILCHPPSSCPFSSCHWVRWHHWLDGRDFEQASGDGGQGSLACCSPWYYKESDMTEQLNNLSIMPEDHHYCNKGRTQVHQMKIPHYTQGQRGISANLVSGNFQHLPLPHRCLPFATLLSMVHYMFPET